MKYKFKHFSDNIVFFDTEFNGNNLDAPELLSIGMVNYEGEELYVELETFEKIDPWVSENVLPHLSGNKVGKEEALRNIQMFVGETKPYLMSFVIPFDYTYLKNLIGFNELKNIFHWPPIDFASILYGNNIDPESYYQQRENNFFSEIGIDALKYNTHNALDDAKLLREVYLKMTKYV